MSWWMRIVVFVPAVYLVMLTYVAPRAADAAGVARLAAQKTVKVLAWSVALVVVMELIQALFLP